MKICIVGSGYVGLSLAILISQKHEVSLLDINEQIVNLVNDRVSPIKDIDIEKSLADKKLNLNATTNKDKAFSNAKFIVIATPTDYDVTSGSFNTSSVEQVIANILELNCLSTIVIKSTIPIGFTDTMRNKFNKKDIFFSPEFLRETKALHDNLYPSRIVLGDNTEESLEFGNILIDCSMKDKDEIKIITMKSKEAEAVKLFSNTFLALRVAFFNELDSYSEYMNLSSKKIIEGVSADGRIGNYYNNPSFGYGGYCLPKDTKQLLKNFSNVPNNIISSVVEANMTRKDFIAKSIINKSPKTVGVYRLVMKEGSDNFKESAVIDILDILKRQKIKIVIYEPLLLDNKFQDHVVITNIEDFIEMSDLIIANRISDDLKNAKNKVYSRDLFQEN